MASFRFLRVYFLSLLTVSVARYSINILTYKRTGDRDFSLSKNVYAYVAADNKIIEDVEKEKRNSHTVQHFIEGVSKT